jgi:hypothetical protein
MILGAVFVFMRVFATIMAVRVVGRGVVAIALCRAVPAAPACRTDARCQVGARPRLGGFGVLWHQVPRLDLRTGELYVTANSTDS